MHENEGSLPFSLPVNSGTSAGWARTYVQGSSSAPSKYATNLQHTHKALLSNSYYEAIFFRRGSKRFLDQIIPKIYCLKSLPVL